MAERIFKAQIGAQDSVGEEHVEVIEVHAANKTEAEEYARSECERRFPAPEYYRQRVHVIPPEELDLGR